MKKLVVILCLLCFVLLGGCAQPVEPEDEYTQLPTDPPEEAIPVVVPLVERTESGDIKATIHGGMLFPEETEVLNDQQIADGFIDAVRNEDGSVTYTIAGDRYEEFLKKHQDDCRMHIVQGTDSGSFESVYKAEVNEDFSYIKATADAVGYSGLDSAEACFQLGIYATRAQMYDIDAPGSCVVEVVSDADGKVYESHTYPQEFQLFPADQ